MRQALHRPSQWGINRPAVALSQGAKDQPARLAPSSPSSPACQRRSCPDSTGKQSPAKLDQDSSRLRDHGVFGMSPRVPRHPHPMTLIRGGEWGHIWAAQWHLMLQTKLRGPAAASSYLPGSLFPLACLGEAHPAMLRANSWLYAQGSLPKQCSGDLLWCQGSTSGQLRARQAPCCTLHPALIPVLEVTPGSVT